MQVGIIFLVALGTMIMAQLLQQSITSKKRHEEIMTVLNRLTEKQLAKS